LQAANVLTNLSPNPARLATLLGIGPLAHSPVFVQTSQKRENKQSTFDQTHGIQQQTVRNSAACFIRKQTAVAEMCFLTFVFGDRKNSLARTKPAQRLVCIAGQ